MVRRSVARTARVEAIQRIRDNRYAVRLEDGRVIRLDITPGPLVAGRSHAFGDVQLDQLRAAVTVPTSMRARDVAPLLAQIVTELRLRFTDAVSDPSLLSRRPVLSPLANQDGRPDLELTVEDKGKLANLEQRVRDRRDMSPARRVLTRDSMARLIESMGLATHQRDVDLLRGLIDGRQRAMVQVFEAEQSLLDRRLPTLAFITRAVISSGVNSAAIASGVVLAGERIELAAALAVPAFVNSLAGAFLDRWLVGKKEQIYRPAYQADDQARAVDFPGLRGLLGIRPSGPTGPPPVRATRQGRYGVRHVGAAAVGIVAAYALVPLGVDPMSALIILGLSAGLRAITERVVDAGKFGSRLRRVDHMKRTQEQDPETIQNQLLAALGDLQQRAERLAGVDLGRDRKAPPELGAPPGFPSLGLHFTVQTIDQLPNILRRAIADGGPLGEIVARLVTLQGLAGVLGPSAVGAVAGAVADARFMGRDEAEGDKRRTHEVGTLAAAFAQELLAALGNQLPELELRLRQLEEQAGLRPAGETRRLADRADDRAELEASATRLRPPDAPEGERPFGLAPYWVWFAQVGVVSALAIGAAIGLDMRFDLTELQYWLALTGGVGAAIGVPLARYVFKRSELLRFDRLNLALGAGVVNPAELDKMLARVQFLVEEMHLLADQAEGPAQVSSGPVEQEIAGYRLLMSEDGRPPAFPSLDSVDPTDGRVVRGSYTDQVRAAVDEARRLLHAEQGRENHLLEERLDALWAIRKAADRLDTWTAASEQLGNHRPRALARRRLQEALQKFRQLTAEALIPDPLLTVPNSPEPGTTTDTTPDSTTATSTGDNSTGDNWTGDSSTGDNSTADAADESQAPADPAAGPVSGQMFAQDSRNRAPWNFGRPQTPDAVLLELRDIPPPRPMRPGLQPPAVPLEWAFGAGNAHGLIPPGVQLSGTSFTRLEGQLRRLITASQELTVLLRAVPGPGGNRTLVVSVSVTDTATARTKFYRNLPVDKMTDALSNHFIRPPSGVTAQQARGDRSGTGHRYLTPAQVDPAQGPVSGEVASTTSANRARWSFGTPGRPDEVVLELREVLPPEPLLDADGKPEALPRIALDWAFARRRARDLVPPGVSVPEQDFAALEQRIQSLIAAGQVVSLRLRVLTGSDGRPELVADAAVREETSGRTALHQELSLPELIDALDNQVLTEPDRLAEDVDGPTTQAAAKSSAETLRAAAQRVNADEGAHGRRTHAPQVRGTRFVADGRTEAEGPLTVGRILAAVKGVLGADLGGLAADDPAVDGETVVVLGSAGPQHFQVRIGHVRRGKLAATEAHRGTAEDPHVVTFAPGIPDSQLARVWVHEISHTLQELRAPDGGPLRRLWTRLTGGGPNACVDAQFNEFHYLRRQWEAGGDRRQDAQLRNDIEGLLKAIRSRGHTPPPPPWNGPRTDSKAAVTGESTLDETVAALTALVDSKRAAARAAEAAARKADEELTEAQQASDDGAIGRRRAAEAEKRKQSELAAWHEHLATKYERARAEVLAAGNGGGYQAALATLAPPSDALPSMQPSGPLPHLTALTERMNAALVANGIDHRFTASELQQLLSAEFGRVLTGEGVVLRVGTKHRADLRVQLSVDELLEVPDPKVKASEIINGLFPQGGRRLATTATSKLGWAFTVPMKALLQLLGTVTHQPWLGDLTLKGELSGGRSRSVTGNAAEYAQTGAVEDNRGESVLYAGKASWELDIRIDRATGWIGSQTVAEGKENDATELRAWVSHAYTVDPAQDQAHRKDLQNGRLPAHHLTSVTGLERLTDDVVEANQDRLTELADGRSQVEEQLHTILTNDLPSRLSDSTDHAVLRPLTVDGKPVGHVAVTTRIRYETVEMVGTQSTTHWQESVRIGFSNTSTQQAFGASTSVSAKAGYDGAAVQDIDPNGTDIGPTVSGGRSATRSDALSGGGTSIHVGVHRFVGPTQAYKLVLDHEVTVELDGETATTGGDSTVMARVRVRDAYQHGLPVAREAVRDGGRSVDGDVDPKAVVPGRKLELPSWAEDAEGRLAAAGPWNVQSVTGGKAAFEAIVNRLADRGFVPPLNADGQPDLTKLSADPIERQGQLRNLEELREQLSTERLEAGYDLAVRDGILVTLTHPRTTQATETVVLRIGIEPQAAKPIGVTSNEAVVLLNIGSETAGRTSSRSKAWPWSADPLSTSSTSGLDGRASLSYGRQALGRVLAWMTGGTVNQVTLLESTAPVAVFEVRHTLTVSEGEETFHTSGPDETARLLIDSDLLPYDETLPATPPSGPVRASVLQRTTLLTLGAAEFTTKLPKAIRTEATALQQLGVFLNPRNLLSHPEWMTTGYRTTLVVPGIAGVSRRIPVTLTGELQNAQLVAVTDGVSGDINLALGSHGSGVGRSTGGSTKASAGASENSTGGGFTASLGSSASTGSANQDIWGVERLTIETGRHYVFTADAEVSLAVGNHQPPAATVGTVFQLAEREALRFYAQQGLALPLQQVADAVERYRHGNLELDRRAAVALVQQYLADLAAARRDGLPVPAVSAEHTTPVLVATLRLRPRPAPTPIEDRLNQVMRDEPPAKIDLPAHYEEHLGFSLIESTELDNELLAEVSDVLRTDFGVDPGQDPALAQALFVDLAGKRWWGRLEDMLGRSGFVRSYPVGRPGELSAEQVTLRIRAEFDDDAQDLGAAKDVVGIVQRYLYGDRSRFWSSGRSTGIGVDGSADATRSGSASTDRAEGTSTSAGDQVTRLERIAGFDGMTRVGRRLRLRIEVEHDAAAPTRTPFGRKVSPRLSTVTKPRKLSGKLVQLIPTAAVGKTMPPVLAVPGSVTLPSMYHVEGVGPADGRADLLDVVAEALADQDALGADGVRTHRSELEHKLSASARNATFSRMASAEGLTLAPLEVPGTKQDTVEVTIRARVSAVEVITAPFEGELGEVNRHMETASTTTSTGRMLPVGTSGTYSAADAGGSGSVGDQLSDVATDLRGARTERSHFEKGKLVTVRVRVDYDLTITRNRHIASGETRELSTTYLPAAAIGRAYLTLHEHDLNNLHPSPPAPANASSPPPAPVTTPPDAASGGAPQQVIPSRWRPIHTGASTLLAIQRAQRWAEEQRRSR